MSRADAVERAARRLSPATAPGERRPFLRVIPGGASRAPRAPFVALVLVVLGVGLIGLLLLNSALQQGSFEVRDLERNARELRAAEAALLHDLAEQAAPDVLVQRARALDMEPAEERAWLDLSSTASGDESP
jgi:hypothetical protein